MDLLQRVHHRHDDRHRLLHSESSVLLQVLFEVLPVNKFHDDIRGIVFNKIIVYGHEILFARVFGHIFGLFEEIIHSLFVEALRIRPTGHFRRYSHLTACHGVRKVFLDRHMHIQFDVGTVICDPESALPDHAVDPVFQMQYSTGKKINRI